ncbi:MAG: glycosyltransferase [Bacteriovoracaceae bacterium]|nr:glycosyltransferase [Bacteriovoracaceae bacterium]
MTSLNELNYKIILISWKRSLLLKSCLQSLEDSGIDIYEKVILIINGEDQETEKMLNINFPKLDFKLIEKTTPAKARNIAISLTNADWAFFIDDDSSIPQNYFSILEQNKAKLLTCSAFGGPDLTPKNSSPLEKAIGQTLKSPLATATTRYRHNPVQKASVEPCDEKKLILCNLWINLSDLRRHNLRFPEDMQRNEENILLFQMKVSGLKICYLSDLYVYHHRSSTLTSVWEKSFSSGFHRIKTIMNEPDSIELTFLIPMFFVLYLTSCLFLLNIFYLIPFFIYCILVLFFSFIYRERTEKIRGFLNVLAVHVVINIAYGCGSLSSLIKKDIYWD